ncbi:hypothetical protein [Pseudodesulfovibrio profundus]|jgi:hypothetical protein|nr:hypothetical protein [Pseudodesulfovibrio profundus]
MRTLRIAGFVALAVVVLWLVALVTGSFVFDNTATTAVKIAVQLVLQRWLGLMLMLFVAAVGVAIGYGLHVAAGNSIIQNHAENCREKERELSMQINKARNERAKISRQIEEQGGKRADEVERDLVAKNRATELALGERERAVSEREVKATKREDAAYHAAQNVAQFKDLRSMYLAQIGRAIEALEEGNPGRAHKILTKDRKTYRRRRSRKPQNAPKRN